MRNAVAISILLGIASATSVHAQQAATDTSAMKSEPGKVSAVHEVKASALVTAVDPATRTLSLKLADGTVYDMAASDEVKNFDQIKVGDHVNVSYTRALTLELRKPGSTKQNSDTTGMERSKPGEKPGGAVGRHVTVIADVIDVDPKHKTITVKGPKGNVVVLDVQNPEQFKVVKKGDQIEADYVEAVAIHVTKAK
jgi:hypothetical protein